MEIVIKTSFLKQLKKLPPKVQLSVRDVIQVLRTTKNLETSGLDHKLMEGQGKGKNYYRIRIGQWRIEVEVTNPHLVVITILSRGDIYKHFPPR